MPYPYESDTYRPSYDNRGPYRDESRDPRIRHVDRLRPKEWYESDTYRPPNIDTSLRKRRKSLEDDDSDDGRTSLHEIQDEQDRVHTKTQVPTSPSNPRKMKSPPISATTDASPKTSVARTLTVGDNISDPLTCNLIHGDGKLCVTSFSGVDNEFLTELTCSLLAWQIGGFMLEVLTVI